MTDINDGGSAFPIPHDPRPNAYAAEPGMSLREWFAGQALPALIELCSSHELQPGEDLPAMFARRSYEVADAMIKRRLTND